MVQLGDVAPWKITTATKGRTTLYEVSGCSFETQAGPRTCVVSVDRLSKLFNVC